MKAIALFSGGLDSILAVKIILNQGIDILALNFLTPFYPSDKAGDSKPTAKVAAEGLKINFKEIDLSAGYMEIVKQPKYGYGENLNPCIDCKILMFSHAKQIMQAEGASFVISGEVLGQRPKSQFRKALTIIEKESGLEGLILRPLSAKLLPESIPEKEGWVRRDILLGISGRSRKPQIAKAEDFQLKNLPGSAGGCLLTDRGFSRRLRDLMEHSLATLNNIELLKLGRHFRLSPEAKLVVGRNKQENERLFGLKQEGDICLEPTQAAGPLAIARGRLDNDTINLASRIVSRYCDKPLDKGGSSAEIEIEVHTMRVWNTVPNPHWNGDSCFLKVAAVDTGELEQLRI